MRTKSEVALDRLLASMMGGRGNTQGHNFLQDYAASPIHAMDDLSYHLRRRSKGVRVFIPLKESDRVLMFADKSGVYVHEDMMVTFMGEDISHEVGAWQEVP